MLSYSMSMSIINIIECKKERSTKAFAYTPSIFNKSSTTGKIGIFEDFNITQIGIKKDDPH